MRRWYIFITIMVLCMTSCRQFGGKIAFVDDEWTKMRENEQEGFDWYTMLDAYHEKWTINGLHLFVGISADHTIFSSKEPYFIVFTLQRTDAVRSDYIQFTIKDVTITGTSGKDYQILVDKIFPITALLDNTDFLTVRGQYRSNPIFPFSFENLVISFTLEVITTDIIESKKFEYHLSPHNNPPEFIWQYMWR